MPSFIFIHPFLLLFPSTGLISLTSYHHLCDLTFVHSYINVTILSYIIIVKKKINSTLLFLVRLLQQTHFIMLTSQHLPNKPFNELRKRVDWTCGCQHPTVYSCSRNTFLNMIQCFTGFAGKVLYVLIFYEIKSSQKRKTGYLGVWIVFLNYFFQFLNNILYNLTYFFTHMYFYKYFHTINFNF